MTLSTEQGLQILICWLQDNIGCDSNLIFDNDDDQTDSTALLPCVEQALSDVRDMRHLHLLHNPKAT
jgi:hypothetical protein